MTAVLRTDPQPMTVDEFLAWRGGVPGVIYELVDGVVRAQDAPSATHGSVHTNLIRTIATHLKAHWPRCRLVTTPGIKPHLAAAWNHRIPEMAITCTPSKPNVRDIEHPIVIVEVLSESNFRDTWSNVPLYASLPSVQEILLVESTAVGAHVLRRAADGVWPADASPVDAKLGCRVESFDLSLPFPEIYADTYLEADAILAASGQP
jgi:Uma2 family endonuclease